MKRSRRRCWLRLLQLALAWLFGVAGWIVWVGARDQAQEADAIVVLGAAAYDAAPSPVFRERIEHGLALYRRGAAPRLIFTGGYGGRGARFAESEVARRYALRHGIPPEVIWIETRSQTTCQNLLETRELLRAHGWARVIVVSDPLHMARALRLSRRLEINALGSPTPTTRFRSPGPWLNFLVREVWFFHRDLFSAGRLACAPILSISADISPDSRR